VIHRDVKPANVMLDERDRPLLTDFGLARSEGGKTLTVDGQLAGTPSYMSPEQVIARRLVIDHRTDIYSLGIVLYELLALRPPFDGDTLDEIMRAISFDVPARVRSLHPDTPKDLETICHTAIEKSPDARYPSAGEMAADLCRFVEGRPILARPPGLLRRLRTLEVTTQDDDMWRALMPSLIRMQRQFFKRFGPGLATISAHTGPAAKPLPKSMRKKIEKDYSDRWAASAKTVEVWWEMMHENLTEVGAW